MEHDCGADRVVGEIGKPVFFLFVVPTNLEQIWLCKVVEDLLWRGERADPVEAVTLGTKNRHPRNHGADSDFGLLDSKLVDVEEDVTVARAGDKAVASMAINLDYSARKRATIV